MEQLGFFACELDAEICGCLSHNGFLTRRGYEAVTASGVDVAEAIGSLDKVGSVSEMDLDADIVFDDQLLEEQHRRFHNGF